MFPSDHSMSADQAFAGSVGRTDLVLSLGVVPDSVEVGAPARPAAGSVLARRAASLAPRIVIAGGGFAGVTTALELARRSAGVLPVHITLVSNRNFFLFTPMLAEAATGAVETRHILYPIRPLCGTWGVEFAEMSIEW